MTALAGWENFYVIVGSSAGALIGLQFVVITLIAAMPIGRGTAQAGAAFSTPNVVHFGAVLLLAGIVSTPWGAIVPRRLYGALSDSAALRTRSSSAGRCKSETYTSRYSKTGCFIYCFRWRRMRCSPCRPSWLDLIRAQHCFLLELRRCCCCSSAFTMRGMRLHTTCLKRNRQVRGDLAANFTRMIANILSRNRDSERVGKGTYVSFLLKCEELSYSSRFLATIFE